MKDFEETDEYCPYCDNHYYIEAETPEQKGGLTIQFDIKKGHEHKLMKDDREKDRAAVLMEFDEKDDDF